MIVTFCGHSDFLPNEKYRQALNDIFDERIGDEPAELFIGGYGEFDSFVYACAKRYQSSHPKTKLIFVTPYITEDYQKNHLKYKENEYDGIIYPEIEHVPLRFAISHRNRWMAEKAELVIAYVSHSFGGAYSMLKAAKSQKKEIINLASLE